MKTRTESAETKSAISFAIFLCPQKARCLALLFLLTCSAPIAAYAEAGGIPKEVVDLQAAVATVQTQVVVLQSSNTSLDSAVAALQTRVTTLESANATLESAVAALKAQVANLESVKTALLNAVLALQGKDADQDYALASLKNLVNPESFQASVSNVGIPSDNADHLVVKLDLPAGLYAVIVKGTIGATAEEVQTVFQLSTPGVGVWDQSILNQDEHGIDGLTTEYGNVSLLSNVGLPTGGTINVTCRTGDDGFFVPSLRIMAVKVGSLH